MKLNTIPKDGQWSNISDRLNDNFSKVDVAVEALQDATIKNCGYFSTANALREAYPTASAGAKAYVGLTYPFAIYLWDATTSAWVDSGETGGEESVPLADYYSKIDIDKQVSELEAVNVMQDVEIGNLKGFNDMPKFAGQLANTAINKTEIDVAYFKVVVVSAGDKVVVKANDEGASLIAILKSLDFTNLSQLDFATGYSSRSSIKASASSKFSMPEDAHYIVVACLWGSQERTPADIKINGKSIMYKEPYVTEKKLSAIYLGTKKRHILQSIEWGSGTISTDGSENEASDYVKTDYIDVRGIDLLRIDMRNEGSIFCPIGFYDENKNFIKRLSTRESIQFQFNGNLKDNADVCYVKIAANTTDLSAFTISVDVLPARYYNRRLLGNKNIKSFSHAGSSVTAGITAGNNLPSSMWGTYLNGFDVIHCNVRYTSDNVGYCLHDETFVDDVTGETIVVQNVTSQTIEACRRKGQPIAKVESVIYLAKIMGLDVCLYNVYGRLDTLVVADIMRLVKTYGMFEHTYFGIPNTDNGRQYLDAIYAEYPKAKVLFTQLSISIVDYAQITETLERAEQALLTRPELEAYLWLNSGYDAETFAMLNAEKPSKIKVGCFQVTQEQEPIVLPYIDIYTSADGLRSFGIARRDIEVAVTNKYPEFLAGDYGNIV